MGGSDQARLRLAAAADAAEDAVALAAAAGGDAGIGAGDHNARVLLRAIDALAVAVTALARALEEVG